MAKIKVLQLTQATGGVKTYVAQVLAYADQQQFEFVVAAPKDTLFEAFCAERHIRYYQIDLERGNNPIKNIWLLWHIIQIIHKERPGLIHAHSAKGGFLGRIAGKLTGVKVIYTPHAFSYLSFSGFKRICFYFLEYLTRNGADILLAISYTEANTAIYELGYSTSKVKVILNAIPLTEEPGAEHRYQNLKIGSIGRLTLQKNPLQFLHIAHRLINEYPFLQFTILGAGIHDELKPQIENYISQYNLSNHISILSWGNTKTGSNFLKELDIFLMTSIFEGLPFSLLEAMSHRIPCVVSKVSGNTDVIQNAENGFACLSNDEFYEKLKMLIDDPLLRKKLGDAGYAYVNKHHNLKTTIHLLEDLYNSPRFANTHE